MTGGERQRGPVDAKSRLERLSRREREVVTALMEDWSIEGVCTRLDLSRHTVRNHLKSIYRKLDVHSRAELTSLLADTSPRAAPPRAPEALPRLTRRQREILALLAEGRRLREVADALGLGIGTVRNHVNALHRKLGVRTRAELVWRYRTAIEGPASSPTAPDASAPEIAEAPSSASEWLEAWRSVHAETGREWPDRSAGPAHRPRSPAPAGSTPAAAQRGVGEGSPKRIRDPLAPDPRRGPASSGWSPAPPVRRAWKPSVRGLRSAS